jgi:hypothetical protein
LQATRQTLRSGAPGGRFRPTRATSSRSPQRLEKASAWSEMSSPTDGANAHNDCISPAHRILAPCASMACAIMRLQTVISAHIGVEGACLPPRAPAPASWSPVAPRPDVSPSPRARPGTRYQPDARARVLRMPRASAVTGLALRPAES